MIAQQPAGSGALDDMDLSGLELLFCGGERVTPAAERAVNNYLREHGSSCKLRIV